MKTYASCLAMVVVQIAYGGSNILIKIAFDKGLNQLVLIVYRHAIATLILGPLAYVLEREKRPSLSISAAMKIFVLSSLGTTIYLNVYYVGLRYTSATVACALSNVIPCSTFIMAVLLRMEKVKIRSARGQAKVLGTVISVAGSLIFTFWKGGFLLKVESRPLINLYSSKNHSKENWIMGSALILISCLAWSGWIIMQAVVYKAYPASLSLNTLICFFASLQSAFLALFYGRNPSLWRLEWNVQLLTIIYCGIVISSFIYYLQTWCISTEGPVFTAMFTPLVLIFVALFSMIAFAEQLHLSSLLGAFVIIVGLYCVLWGKKQDVNKKRDENVNQQPEIGETFTTTDTETLEEISTNDTPRTHSAITV